MRRYVKATVSMVYVNVKKDLQDGHVVRFSISIHAVLSYEK